MNGVADVWPGKGRGAAWPLQLRRSGQGMAWELTSSVLGGASVPASGPHEATSKLTAPRCQHIHPCQGTVRHRPWHLAWAHHVRTKYPPHPGVLHPGGAHAPSASSGVSNPCSRSARRRASSTLRRTAARSTAHAALLEGFDMASGAAWPRTQGGGQGRQEGCTQAHRCRSAGRVPDLAVANSTT